MSKVQCMSSLAAAVVCGAGLAMAAQGQVVTLTASLSGLEEVPPNASPATGFATLQIDIISRAWTLDISWGTLIAPMTVAHIHRAPIGVNGPVIIGLDGSGSPAWPLFAPGSTSFNSGGALPAPFLWPASELQNLLDGNTYINIHSQFFPGGEIRGQLVPVPGAGVLLAMGGLLASRRRR